MSRPRIKVVWTDWGTATEREARTWEEASEFLRALADSPEPPSLVELYDPVTRRAIGVGIGRDVSVVTYQDSLDPPFYVSLGPDPQRDDEWFCYGNEESEFPGRNLVSRSEALAALEQFFRRPGRPETLEWERL